MKLTDLCDIQYGYAFDSESFCNDKNYPPLIRIRDIKRGYSETFYSAEYPSEYIVHAGDLLVGMDGEFNIARWRSRDGLLNQRVCKITAKETADEEYLRFALSRALKGIENRTAFVTVKHLSAKELNKLELKTPDVRKQSEIAALLSRIEGIIEKRQKEIDTLDSLIKARFVEMFGDPVENPKGYRVDTLQALIDAGDITYHLDGNHGGDYPRSEEFVSKGVPYIGANCIVNGKIDFSLAKFLTPERAGKLRKGIAQNNDVLFAHNATVGPTVVLHTEEPKVILSTSLTAYRCNKDSILPEYLATYMRSEGFVMQYSNVMKQTTRNQVPITAQKKYLFLVPPVEEQKQFSVFVAQVNKSRFAVQKALDETKVLFESLMQEYFG